MGMRANLQILQGYLQAFLQECRRSWTVDWGMPGNRKWMCWRDRAAIAASLALALLASGCGGGGNLFGAPSASAPTAAPTPASDSSGGGFLRGDIAGFFSGSSDKAPQAVAGATADVECPYIQIREGASTLTINGAGANAAMSLKYQGTFVRAARQCAVVAGQMVMKIGVQGRLILGPQGSPGEITVPLRIAVVDEKPASSKTIVTKLIMIPVAVRSADDNPSFTHVEDNVTFPMPSSSELDNYVVYIGFDPIAAQAQDKHRAPRPKVRRKPVPRVQAAPPLRTN
jgi:hypothetical protein